MSANARINTIGPPRAHGRRPWRHIWSSLCLAGLVTGSVVAEEGPGYSAPVGQNYPRNLYWGDTHLHTRNSADAYSLGNMNLTPADAFRFARGRELQAHNGMRVQLRRPLDFLVVSDHAEYLGGYYRFNVGDRLVIDTETASDWQAWIDEGDPDRMIAAFSASISDPDQHKPFPERTRQLIWEDVVLTAEEHNQPGQFTAFVGYEWTSMIDGNNLHRVVVYRDGVGVADRMPPFSAQDSIDPRDLWQALARYQAETGGEAIAIPHNGNLSNGLMFANKTLDGNPLDAAYARLRSRWEPVVEVTQVKGDSEAHPTLSPDDEFADFENWDWDNIGRNAAKEDWMLAHEYARGALKLGLAHQANLGVNPFKFGMIGSSDGHNTFSTVQEDNFFGKFPESEPSVARMYNAMAADRLWANWHIVASGYAAIWARDNTRKSLFDAMKRREVYATTGSRISVRFFAGWEYEAADLDQPAWLDTAYGKGVPMGGDLAHAPEGGSPTFLLTAARDPDGANLDRVQIVKGWRDAAGNLHEKVHDIAWSGERAPDPETGKVGPVGSTIDIKTATFDNSIGDKALAGYWRDPDFDPAEPAFYYARVIEIPTPRWTAYDAVWFNLELPEEIPMTVQDRAYTSPIWYTPQ